MNRSHRRHAAGRRNTRRIVAAAVLMVSCNCMPTPDTTEMDPNSLLSESQRLIAAGAGGDLARYIAIYTQHAQGVTGNYLAAQEYELTAAMLEDSWNSLQQALAQVDGLREVADAQGYHYFSGIARVLEAYTRLVLTDYWGDLPDRTATETNASFDGQLLVYGELLGLLNTAQLLLAENPGAVIPTPESDLIYGSAGTLTEQMERWQRLSHSLAARAYLHLGKVDAANYAKALAELSAGLASSSDDAEVDTAHPWVPFIATGAMNVDDNYAAILQSLNDPRGARYGVPLAAGHPYLTDTRKWILMRYTEHNFIEAECRMRTEGATAATHQAYLDGIAESFNHLGLAASYAAYVGQAAVDPGQANLTLNEIMTQKYLALFLDPEVDVDHRRTGIPSLTPNTGSALPRRLPYPQTLVDGNANTPQVTLFDRVWWDQ